jgi:predicted Zn-dependent peptidase
VLLAAAGRLSHDRLVAAAEATFGDLRGVSTRAPTSPPSARPGLTVHSKALEQAHICIGVPGIRQSDPARYAAHVLTQALGGGMSSRLFQEIRERRGKAYTVYAFLPTFHDGGYLGVYVGTSAAWAREVVDVVRAEFGALVDRGLRPEELARTKAQIKGSMLLGLETSESRMGRLARNEMYFQRDVPLDEIAGGIDAVGPDDVLAVARRLLRPEALAVTVLGDVTEAGLGSGILDL